LNYIYKTQKIVTISYFLQIDMGGLVTAEFNHKQKTFQILPIVSEMEISKLYRFEK